MINLMAIEQSAAEIAALLKADKRLVIEKLEELFSLETKRAIESPYPRLSVKRLCEYVYYEIANGATFDAALKIANDVCLLY